MKSIIKLNHVSIDYKVYSDGSVGINIPHNATSDTNFLQCHLLDSQGIFALYQILEHLKETNQTTVLSLDYLPFARQDRSQSTAEVFIPNSFKSFVRTLSTYKSEILEIILVDPHSSFNIEAFKSFDFKVFVIPQLLLLETTLNSFPSEIDYVISPDKGAVLKSLSIADFLQVPLLSANKTRDPITHEVKLEIDCISKIPTINLENKTILIADDIIDYGTSIHELTKQLKEKYKGITILVFISHAILPFNTRLEIPSRFSYALQYVDMFNCYNLLPDNTEPSDVDIPINAFNIL